MSRKAIEKIARRHVKYDTFATTILAVFGGKLRKGKCEVRAGPTKKRRDQIGEALPRFSRAWVVYRTSVTIEAAYCAGTGMSLGIGGRFPRSCTCVVEYPRHSAM